MLLPVVGRTGMSRLIPVGIALTLIASWSLSTAPGPAEAAGTGADHVILVDWDGLNPEYLELAPTPNIDALARRGSLTIAEGTFQTVSNPSRASMSTGAYLQIHDNAAYYYDEEMDRAVGQNRFLATETITQALASENKTLASVQWYMVQDRGAAYGDPDHLYVQPGGSCERRVDVAVDILNQRPVDSGGQMTTVPRIPDFLALYCFEPDFLGHTEGAESPNIAALIGELDRQLGRLVQATKDLDIYDETAFILTSDHGMTSWNRTLIPVVLEAIVQAGYLPEIVTPGNSASPETEVVIVPNAVRTGQIRLRGRANRPDALEAIRDALEALEEVENVFGPTELASLHASLKMGDLVVRAKPPWGFALIEPPEGAWRGSHGSTRELRIPLLLAGAGIERAPPRDPRLIDVAPTVAALLGTRPPAGAEGRPLVDFNSFCRGASPAWCP